MAGFDPGPVDGVYGLLTTAAVRELQQTFGLREDGLAGPEVWRVLTDPEALITRPRTLLQANEKQEELPLTYRLAWPRLSGVPGVPGYAGQRAEQGYRFGPTSASSWSRTILAASMPHLSGLVTYILVPRLSPVTPGPGPLGEVLPIGDLPGEAARAGRDRWILLSARSARDLGFALAQGCRSNPGPGRTCPESDAPACSEGKAGGWRGVLADASGFRLPKQLPELLALLVHLRTGLRSAALAGAGGGRLEVVLPAVPAATGPFWRVFRQVCARLSGRADRLWLLAFRRPEDFPVTGQPLHLVELERMLALARETWAPWRLGIVLPAGGWWADGRPLTRREALALRQRQPRPVVVTTTDSHAARNRDRNSGLLLLGGAEAAGGVPEAYLVDQETWRFLLRSAQTARVGGLAVYPWGEEHPSQWKIFPEFSGRLCGENEASPPARGI